MSVGNTRLVKFLTSLDLFGISEKLVSDLTVLLFLYSPDTEIKEADG